MFPKLFSMLGLIWNDKSLHTIEISSICFSSHHWFQWMVSPQSSIMFLPQLTLSYRHWLLLYDLLNWYLVLIMDEWIYPYKINWCNYSFMPLPWWVFNQTAIGVKSWVSNRIPGFYVNVINPLHNDFCLSSGQPEQRKSFHPLLQPTDGYRATFHKYCCYIKHGGIIANLNLWNLWGDITDMSKYHNVGIWSMDYKILCFMLKNI